MARDLSLERVWRDRIERHQRSGVTVQEFCKAEGIVPHQFFWWRRELKRRVAGSDRSQKKSPRLKKSIRKAVTDGSGFVPVRVASVVRKGYE